MTFIESEANVRQGEVQMQNVGDGKIIKSNGLESGKESLENYRTIVGDDMIDDLYLLGARLRDVRVQHVNSTAVGGGVAEILNRMLPMLNSLGVETTWEVIKGGDDFFRVTKGFHNALQGMRVPFTKEDYECYLRYNMHNSEETKLDADVVFIHDPQPAAMIEQKKRGKWVWRCHIDMSQPDPEVWRFLKGYVSRYDGAIFSSPKFARPDLSVRQFLVAPSIDPLAEKNRELTGAEIERVLDKFGISREKPLITQISRFDRYKDPAGVIRAYKMVKKHVDVQLVLAGSMATDDPEGVEVLRETQALAEGEKDVKILLLPPFSDVEINALQRASAVVLQKSLKEGFGLTVSEALWKGRPVIAGACGGIPLQIKNGITGFLTDRTIRSYYQAYWLDVRAHPC